MTYFRCEGKGISGIALGCEPDPRIVPSCAQCAAALQCPLTTSGELSHTEEGMAVLPKFVGERIKRREDPALIQGLGQ
jgi:hypothetical protein